MLIENKWVVFADDMYYTGDSSDGSPVFERLNSRVRTYKSERGAKSAIRHIKEESGGAALCELKAVYIEREDVPDVSSDKPERNPPIIKNDGGWEIVDWFGKIKYVKKMTTAKPVFAVLDENGDLRGFGFDELCAWLWYSDLRRNVGARLIRERGDSHEVPEMRNRAY